MSPSVFAAKRGDPLKESTMKTENVNVTGQLFRNERRRSALPFFVAAALLVSGYVGASVALIDNYTNQTAHTGGPRA
jgi:hypothetical protein